MRSSSLRRSLSPLALALLCLFFCAQSSAAPVYAVARPDPVTLTVAADAWIDQSNPDANFGATPVLHVALVRDQGGSLRAQEALIIFELSPLPMNVIIDAAALSLFQIGAAGPGAYPVWPKVITQPWDELEVTWSSRPERAGTGDPVMSIGTAVGWVGFDVTNIVQAWVSGQAPNYGLVLEGDWVTEGYHEFQSREPLWCIPVIRVEYHFPDAYTPTSTRVPTPTWTATRTRTPTRTPVGVPTGTSTRTPATRTPGSRKAYLPVAIKPWHSL